MLSDEQDAEVARIRERWSNGPTGRYPEATEAADQYDIESLLAMLDAARAAERAQAKRIEAVLPSPERFEKQRQHVRRVYSNASERGFLIGSLNVEEALANKVRAALRPEAATTEGAGCSDPDRPEQPLAYCAECGIPAGRGLFHARACHHRGHKVGSAFGHLGAFPPTDLCESCGPDPAAAAVHPDTEGKR